MADDKDYKDYQDYLAYQQHLQGTAAPKTSVGSATLEGFGNGASFGYLPQLQASTEKGVDKLQQFLGVGAGGQDAKLRAQGFNLPEKSYTDSRDENLRRQQTEEQEHPIAAGLGKIGGMVASGAAMPGGAASRGVGLAGKMVRGAVSGAAQGAAYNPGDEQGVVHNPLEGDFQGDARKANAKVGGLVGGTLPLVAAGLSKAGDWGMQKAVGLKKYIPGLGEKLSDEGLVGTKSGMASQVQGRLADRGQALESTVGGMKGPIDSVPVADDVRQMANRFQTAGGDVPSAVAGEHGLVSNTANEIAGRGQVSPTDALKYKRIAGEVGYDAGRPLSGLQSEIAQHESGAYGKALENAYSAQNPGAPNQVADLNSSLSSLLKAKKALNAPQSIQEAIRGAILPDAVGAGLGYAKGGDATSAIAGAAAMHSLRSPLARSLLSQAAIKGSGALTAASPLITRETLESARKR